jgi:hypothetical protein
MKQPIGMTKAELRALPVSVDLVTAARAFGIGRSGAYDLQARGEFPCVVLKVGRRLVVPRAEILRALGVTDAEPAGATAVTA